MFQRAFDLLLSGAWSHLQSRISFSFHGLRGLKVRLKSLDILSISELPFQFQPALRCPLYTLVSPNIFPFPSLSSPGLQSLSLSSFHSVIGYSAVLFRIFQYPKKKKKKSPPSGTHLLGLPSSKSSLSF